MWSISIEGFNKSESGFENIGCLTYENEDWNGVVVVLKSLFELDSKIKCEKDCNCEWGIKKFKRTWIKYCFGERGN